MSTKVLKKAAGNIKGERSTNRAVLTANESYIGNVFRYGLGAANALEADKARRLAAGSGSSSSVSSGPIDVAMLASLGGMRAKQLLQKSPELTNTNTVMLPNGNLYSRPVSEITVEQARRLVAQDIAIGRRPNDYEYGLASGDILTREQQNEAQRALYKHIGNEMATVGTFDYIPPPPQELLRRAAGIIPMATKTNVELKTKIWGRDNPEAKSSGGGGGSGGGGKGYMGGKRAHSDWKAILNRVTSADSAKKNKIYEAFNSTEPGKKSDLEAKLKGLGISSSDVSELIDKLKFE